MAAIFISYSSKQRHLTQQLAKALEAQGYTTWWDHALESHGSFEKQVVQALNEARAVVVVWSVEAAQSEWVRSEAQWAASAGTLVNVRAPGTPYNSVPKPYDVYHIQDIEDLEGILRSIASVLSGRPLATKLALSELYWRQHGKHLLDARRLEPALNIKEISPAELLQARYAVVPFIDVTGAKVDMVSWCSSPKRATAGRLVYGSGGVGKTRLLTEVVIELIRQGWSAGFLDPPADSNESTVRQHQQALDQLIELGDDAGLLMIIDYAEARQETIRSLAARLAGRSDEAVRPIRVVLLARTAGYWWRELHDEWPVVERLFRLDGNRLDQVALAEIGTGAQRSAFFCNCFQALARILVEQGYTVAPGEPSRQRLERIEKHKANVRPLELQMEALLCIVSIEPLPDCMSTDVLLRRVLGLERNHWRKLLGALDDAAMRGISRGAAQVTVIGELLLQRSTAELLIADKFYGSRRVELADVDGVARSLARVLGRGEDHVAQLEPDLLGEHHVATESDVELIAGTLTWIASGGDEVQQSRRRRNLLRTLQRATLPEHGPKANRNAAALLQHVLCNCMRVVASDVVVVIADTPGRLDAILDACVDELDFESIRALDRAIPLSNLLLADLALKVARCRAMIATMELQSAQTPTAGSELLLMLKAEALDSYSARLSSIDRHEDALEVIRESIAIKRGLVDILPVRHRPELGKSLLNLGAILSYLGRKEETLDVTQEAISILSDPAQHQPEAFLPELATGHHNLALALSALGRRGQALLAIEKAVAIARRRAENQPDRMQPELARNLDTLGNIFCSLGRLEEALTASAEALEIKVQLAKTYPETHLKNLADGLSNFGSICSRLGYHDRALRAAQNALAIAQELVRVQPDACLLGCAQILNSLGATHSNLGNHAEALEATRQAVAAMSSLAATRPRAHAPELAIMLSNLAIMLGNVGFLSEAHKAATVALTVIEPFAEQPHGAHLHDLATVLNSLAATYFNLAQHDLGVQTIARAVEVRRRLARSSPEAFLGELAVALHNFGGMLTKLSRNEEALNATREALDIRAKLAIAHPEAFLPKVAMSLTNLSSVYSKLGRYDEALRAAEESTRIYEKLLESLPDAYQLDLARSLINLATQLSRAGRQDQARREIERSIATLRRLATLQPDAFISELATGLGALCQILSAGGRHEEAAAASRAGLETIATSVQRFPARFRGLAGSLMRDYLEQCEVSSTKPDEDLLVPILGAISSRSQ